MPFIKDSRSCSSCSYIVHPHKLTYLSNPSLLALIPQFVLPCHSICPFPVSICTCPIFRFVHLLLLNFSLSYLSICLLTCPSSVYQFIPLLSLNLSLSLSVNLTVSCPEVVPLLSNVSCPSICPSTILQFVSVSQFSPLLSLNLSLSCLMCPVLQFDPKFVPN